MPPPVVKFTNLLPILKESGLSHYFPPSLLQYDSLAITLKAREQRKQRCKCLSLWAFTSERRPYLSVEEWLITKCGRSLLSPVKKAHLLTFAPLNTDSGRRGTEENACWTEMNLWLNPGWIKLLIGIPSSRPAVPLLCKSSRKFGRETERGEQPWGTQRWTQKAQT